MTRKTAFVILLIFVAATTLLGHAGEVHSHMGTITAADGGSYSMKTTKGQNVSFVTSNSTNYRFADNTPAAAADVTVGARVVVEISKDGKTASSIRIAKKQ